MKFWVKIIVALSIVIVTVFGVWAFFFREKDEVIAYNRTSELIEYKDSISIKEKIDSLATFDYLGEDSSNKIIESNEYSKSILSTREILISDKIITIYDAGGNITCVYDSYLVMEEKMDEMIFILLPYVKNANSGDASKMIKQTVNEYINNLKQLNLAIDNLTTCQKEITGTDTEMTVLMGHYNGVRQKYRRCLKNGSQLIENLMNVIKSNYGSIKFDTRLALIDSYARTLNVLCTEEDDKTETFRAYDLHMILERYNKVNIGESIFTSEYTEYNFLKSYNNLFNNYLSELNKAISKQNINKIKMADGQDLSDIKLEAQESLIYVLNVLGY